MRRSSDAARCWWSYNRAALLPCVAFFLTTFAFFLFVLLFFGGAAPSWPRVAAAVLVIGNGGGGCCGALAPLLPPRNQSPALVTPLWRTAAANSSSCWTSVNNRRPADRPPEWLRLPVFLFLACHSSSAAGGHHDGCFSPLHGQKNRAPTGIAELRAGKKEKRDRSNPQHPAAQQAPLSKEPSPPCCAPNARSSSSEHRRPPRKGGAPPSRPGRRSPR